jgi:hypothetical protein
LHAALLWCRPVTGTYTPGTHVATVCNWQSTASTGVPATVTAQLQVLAPGAKAWATSASFQMTLRADTPVTLTPTGYGAWSYRVYVPGFGSTFPATSVILPVNVPAHAPWKITMKLSAAKVRHGATVKFTATIANRYAGQKVYLQRNVAGVWRTMLASTLTSSAAHTFAYKVTVHSHYRWRVLTPAALGAAAGGSAPQFLTVT